MLQRWRGCAATITESDQDHLYGCLWELDIEHLKTLDDQESVHNGLYERIKLMVCQHFCIAICYCYFEFWHRKSLKILHVLFLQVFGVSTNVTYEVFTYQVREEKMRPLTEDCRPSKVYKGVIVEGALEHGLPIEYIDKLKNIEDNGYGGEVDIGLDLNIPD